MKDKKLIRHLGRFSLLLIIVPLIVMITGYSVVYAQVSQQVTVTATVPEKPPLNPPDTLVIFKGIAYPSSNLTISEGATILSSLTLTAQARFEVLFKVTPGNHTYTISGTDIDGIQGRTSNFTLTLSEGTTTTISGIFLGPTITIDKPSITPGETATLAGTTAPNSSVNVTISAATGGTSAASGPQQAVHTASADNNGRWLQLVNANDLSTGPYTAKAQAIEPSTQSVSEFSKTVAFEIKGGTSDQCSNSLAADINCDSKVNLIDFSILLFFWNTTNPTNARADINRDTKVNITDFSILLFYWTG
ncbi:MAG: dockerin type I domain-containing protein [Patescibacteria group bacterium]